MRKLPELNYHFAHKLAIDADNDAAEASMRPHGFQFSVGPSDFVWVLSHYLAACL